MKKFTAAALVAGAMVSVSAAQAEELTIATVNNGHMIEMQKLSSAYEAETGNTLNWVTPEEGVLRQRVTTDIATKGGQFDVMTIGMYEAPIWGDLGWLEALEFGADYNVEDILPAMRGGLSSGGNLYAAPFYGESSMVMYRKDLVEAAGMSIRDMDSWGNIAKVAEAITGDGVYGVCFSLQTRATNECKCLCVCITTLHLRYLSELGDKNVPHFQSVPATARHFQLLQ